MKYCDKCGAQIPEGSLSCPACQTPVTALPVTNVQPTYAPDQTPIAPVEQLTPVVPAATPAPAPAVEPASQQPTYTQPVTPVPPAQPKEKSAGIPIVIAIILLVVAALSGLLLGRVFFGSADCKKNADKCEITTNNDETPGIDDDAQHNVEMPNEEDEEEPTEVSASKEAYISGHKFTIPGKYYYEVDDEGILYIYDETTDWIAEMTLTQYLYSTISTNIDTIINNFTSSGFTVEGYEEKEISGMTLIEIKVIDSSGVKILAAYAKVSDAYVGVITVYNQTSGEYETEKFEEVAKIMAGAEKSSTSRDNENQTNNTLVNVLPAM